MSEQDDITKLCLNLGAPSEQAVTMSRQLLKRADQIAVERSISREQALAHLLQLLVEGRQGKVPAEFKPPAPRSE